MTAPFDANDLNALALHHRQRLIRHPQRGLDVLRLVCRGQEPIVMRVEQGAAPRDLAAEALLSAQVGIVGKHREGQGGWAGGAHLVAMLLCNRDKAAHETLAAAPQRADGIFPLHDPQARQRRSHGGRAVPEASRQEYLAGGDAQLLAP